MTAAYVRSGAVFSPCRKYRYLLWREWNPDLPRAVFVGLNPSKADETRDDLTLTKCRVFAARFGCGAVDMVNLFALVSTSPKFMFRSSHPVAAADQPGACDDAIREACETSSIVVACWGIGPLGELWSAARAKSVTKLLVREARGGLTCLGRRTRDGAPRHPSRIGYALELEPFGEDQG